MYCHIHRCQIHHCHCGSKNNSTGQGGAFDETKFVELTQEFKEELKKYTVLLKDEIINHSAGIDYDRLNEKISDLELRDLKIVGDLNDRINTTVELSDLKHQQQDTEIQAAKDMVNALPFENGFIPDTFVMKTARGEGQVARTQQDKNAEFITVKDFGAVGDGITDDTQAIQNALNYAVENGTDLHFPACDNYYKITDTLVITNGGKSQYVYPAINITGRYYSSRIRVESADIIEAVISIEGKGSGYWFDSIFIDANDKARHGIKNAEDAYNTQIYMDKVRIFKPTEVGISLRTYFCDLRNCFVESSKVGFKIGGVGSAPATTVNMSGCYAVRCLDVGYDFGYLTYCTFNSLACDDSKLAYRIASAYGVTMNSCGAERVSKFLHVLAFRGLVINAPFVLRLGAQKEGEEPELYGIELSTGYGCTISGVNFVASAIAPVKYILGLTSASYGSNDVNILDSSISSSQVYSVDTYRYGSNSVRGEFYNTIFRSPSKIPVGGPFKLVISDKKIETTYLIELDPGEYPLAEEAVKVLKNLNGSGRIIIRGTGATPAETVIKVTYGGVSLNNCRIPVIFENVSLRNDYNHNNYNTLVFVTSSKVIFKNCIIYSNGRNINSTISGSFDSEILLQDTVFELGGANVSSGIFKDTSPQNISWWGDSLPTVGFVNKGVRFNLNAPEAGQATQYVCVSDAIAETEWVAVNSLVQPETEQPETPPAE